MEARITSKDSSELEALDRIALRVESTPNENLETLLLSLLPKIVPLSNNEIMRSSCISLFSSILKRVKSLHINLPIPELLQLLVRNENELPFAANFALAFIDSSISNVVSSQSKTSKAALDICDKIIDILPSLEVFSVMSNSLLYYALLVLDTFSIAFLNRRKQASIENINTSDVAANIIGDFLLDLCLVTSSIERDAVGSAHNGLTVDRVNRLTAKKSKWTKAELKEYKIKSMLSLSTQWLNDCHSVAMVMTLSNDPDADISTAATFKVNGCRTIFNITKEKYDDLLYAISLCVGWNLSNSLEKISCRSGARDDIRCTILRWVCQDCSDLIIGIARVSLQHILADCMKPDLSMQYKSALLHFLDKVLSSLDDKTVQNISILVVAGIKYNLQPFNNITLCQGTGHKMNTFNSTEDWSGLSLRESCYSIIDSLARRCGEIIVTDVDLLVILFRILDKEDEVNTPKLLACLGALRLCHESSNENNIRSERHGGIAVNDNILDLLSKARNSEEPKNRLMALQWCRALYEWRSFFVFETLVLLSDDSSSLVSFAAKQEFLKLKEITLSYGNGSVNSVTETFLEFLAAKNIFESQSYGKEALVEMTAILNALTKSLLQNTYKYAADEYIFLGADRWIYIATSKRSTSRNGDILKDIVSTLSPSMIGRYCDECRTSESSRNMLNELIRFIKDVLLLLSDANFRSRCRTELLPLMLRLVSVIEYSESSYHLAQCFAIISIDAELNYLHNTNRILKAKLSESVSSSQNCLMIYAATVEILSWRDDIGISEKQPFMCELCKLLQDILRDDVRNTSNGLYAVSLKVISSLAARGILQSKENCLPMTVEFCLDELKRIIEKYEPLIGQTLDSMTRLCLSPNAGGLPWSDILISCDANTYSSIFELFLLSYFNKALNSCDQFVFAECLLRLSLPQDTSMIASCKKYGPMSIDEDLKEAISTMPVLLQRVCDKVFQVIKDKSVEGSLKITSAIILLVLVSQLSNYLSDKFLVLSTELFLILLKEKEPLIQDVSCSGLCKLYIIASERSQASTNLANIIARDVINTLTRERKIGQPAGVALAGETTSTSSEGDLLRLQEDSARGGTGGGYFNSNRPTATIDPLASAAAQAAAELGLSPDDLETLQGRRRNVADRNITDTSFGVYTTACKMAKKSGDASVIFSVLTLVKRDPTFGIGLTAVYASRYKASIPTLDTDKIKSLLPYLYMSKFEPNSTIRDIMKSLWDTLIIKEQKSMTTTLHKEFFFFLSTHLSSGLWREREAACLALNSYLHLPHISWSLLKPWIEKLWELGMRVLDDVRDSTRGAALRFMKSLSEHVIRACDPVDAQDPVHATVGLVLPIIQSKGLLSPSLEGKGFSLGILLEIVKTAKSSLRGLLPCIVSILVESMSAMEPTTLQYMQFHTARLHISEEEVEKLRIQLATNSPLQEALDACLQSLTIDLMPEMMATLCEHLTCGVGLATRCAAVTSIAHIIESYPADVGPFCNKPFQSVLLALLSSNRITVTLRRSLLSGLGALSKVVNAELMSNMCKELIDTYDRINRDDDDLGEAIANCLLQIISRSGDRLLDDVLWINLLATSYVGMFDNNLTSREVWEKLWSEVLSNSGVGTKQSAVLKMYNIVLLRIHKLIIGLSWTRRCQGLSTLDDLIKSISGAYLSNEISPVLRCLLQTIPGRIWKGQDMVLQLLAAIINKCVENLDMSANSNIIFFTDTFVLDIDSLKTRKISDNITDDIAIEIGEFPLENITTNEKTNWRVSARGIISLLIYECHRGERSYRYAAATALSSLPWKHITGQTAGIFHEYVETFIHLAGVNLDSTEFDSYIYSISRGKLGKEAFISRAQLDIVQPHGISTLNVSDVSKKTSRTTSNALFGVRYIGNSEKVQKINHKYRVRTSDRNAGNSSDSSHVYTMTEMDIMTESAANIKVNSTKSLADQDPAFRVKILDMLFYSWPRCTNNAPYFCDFSKQLIVWCCCVMRKEVWSIRRCALDLLGIVASTIRDESYVTLTLIAIAEGAADTKYSKVRKAALEALLNVMEERDLFVMLKNGFHEEVKSVIIATSKDTQPEVLDASSKCSSRWLNLQSYML